MSRALHSLLLHLILGALTALSAPASAAAPTPLPFIPDSDDQWPRNAPARPDAFANLGDPNRWSRAALERELGKGSPAEGFDGPNVVPMLWHVPGLLVEAKFTRDGAPIHLEFIPADLPKSKTPKFSEEWLLSTKDLGPCRAASSPFERSPIAAIREIVKLNGRDLVCALGPPTYVESRIEPEWAIALDTGMVVLAVWIQGTVTLDWSRTETDPTTLAAIPSHPLQATQSLLPSGAARPLTTIWPFGLVPGMAPAAAQPLGPPFETSSSELRYWGGLDVDFTQEHGLQRVTLRRSALALLRQRKLEDPIARALFGDAGDLVRVLGKPTSIDPTGSIFTWLFEGGGELTEVEVEYSGARFDRATWTRHRPATCTPEPSPSEPLPPLARITPVARGSNPRTLALVDPFGGSSRRADDVRAQLGARSDCYSTRWGGIDLKWDVYGLSSAAIPAKSLGIARARFPDDPIVRLLGQPFAAWTDAFGPPLYRAKNQLVWAFAAPAHPSCSWSCAPLTWTVIVSDRDNDGRLDSYTLERDSLPPISGLLSGLDPHDPSALEPLGPTATPDTWRDGEVHFDRSQGLVIINTKAPFPLVTWLGQHGVSGPAINALGMSWDEALKHLQRPPKSESLAADGTQVFTWADPGIDRGIQLVCRGLPSICLELRIGVMPAKAP